MCLDLDLLVARVLLLWEMAGAKGNYYYSTVVLTLPSISMRVYRNSEYFLDRWAYLFMFYSSDLLMFRIIAT